MYNFVDNPLDINRRMRYPVSMDEHKQIPGTLMPSAAREHRLMEIAYFPAYSIYTPVMALSYCQCGVPLTTSAITEIECKRLIGTLYRRHLRSVTQ